MEREEGSNPKRKNRGKIIDNDDTVYRFQVLCPNGITVPIIKRNPVAKSMSLDAFIERVKEKCSTILMQGSNFVGSTQRKRKILWTSKDLYLEDGFGRKIRGHLCFSHFVPNKISFVKLFDGAGQTTDSFQNMWDLTPDTDLLSELPDDYTFETALADLIDNSLQAVWSNSKDDRKLISIEIDEDRVSIFDTGPGMDGSTENSIAKWGKMGASLHRSSKKLAVGGKPPFLTPFFGMFGYGGTIASMHLGRHSVVSAKTKESKKVFWLRLERDALLKRAGSSSVMNWKAPGGIRDPTDDEIEKSEHGSFLKVEMVPKLKVPDVFQLQCKLKDIYFPYIQCDEIAGRTATLVEFQVNDINLAEIDGGEVAVTNMHSCNGPDFVLNIQFSTQVDKAATKSQSENGKLTHRLLGKNEANARLKCVYFPVIEGKESFERILENLNADGCKIKEDFQTFSRISIRRLGRLLPDARWDLLPFMKPKQKRGEKLLILKRCCLRVKCFIDTDAGFNPIPSKTDLAPHHPFTKALKELGGDPPPKGVNFKILRNGKQLSLQQLERDYRDWTLQMHSKYDEEFSCGDDEPIVLIAVNKDELGITADVVRVHQVITRKGQSWNKGQKIKILKGACPGCHKSNIYATIEYFLLENLQGDAGGEARLICRPQEVQIHDGAKLANERLELHSSISVPITVIDSGKCLALTNDDWNFQVEKLNLKLASSIEILGPKQCKALDIDRALPSGSLISAGLVPPKEVVAVLRPANFSPSSGAHNLDQKYIIKENHEMHMEVTFRPESTESPKADHNFSASATNTSRRGCQGLYIFPLRPTLFQKAGLYSFSFSLKNSASTWCEISVQVKASSEIESWELVKDDDNIPFDVSVGSCFPPFSVSRYDKYNNCVAFDSIPDILFTLMSDRVVLSRVKSAKVEMSSDQLHITVRNLRVMTGNLDTIRPLYAASLVLSQPDKSTILSIPCRVIPGAPKSVTVHLPKSTIRLHPRQVVEDVKLEIFDRYNNHVKEGLEIELQFHGFRFQDQSGKACKVDNQGFVDLSGVLKVSEGYSKPVSLSVLYNKQILLLKKFQVEKWELRLATRVQDVHYTGSKLKDIAFEVVDTEGDIDQTIHDDDKHGPPHTLRLQTGVTDNDSLRYIFKKGRCVVPSITLPKRQGNFFIEAFHSEHRELNVKFKVNIRQHQLECAFPSRSPDPKKTSEQFVESIFEEPASIPFENVASLSEIVMTENQPILAQTPEKHYDSNGKHEEIEDYLLRTPESKVTHVDPLTATSISKLMESELQELMDVEDDIRAIGTQIKDHENHLELLGSRKNELEDLVRIDSEELLQVQASVEPVPLSVSYDMSPKDAVVEKIENKVESAASLYSIVSRDASLRDQYCMFMSDVIGLVALIGTAPTPKISRSLAEYLGEDQMLAVVCQSNAVITTPEKYEDELISLASELGTCINGSHLFICLEDIRAFSGSFEEGSSQNRLALPVPVLPDGTSPRGFLGFAVNMIDIDAKHLQTKTSSGHGLRETLFYRLFGELQVYETKENMKHAYCSGCAKDGALSLDGGILRGNGIISLGFKELDVQFPVTSEQSQSVAISETIGDMENTAERKQKQIEDYRKELSLVEDGISYLSQQRSEKLQQFQERKGMYINLLEAKKMALSQRSSQGIPINFDSPGI